MKSKTKRTWCCHPSWMRVHKIDAIDDDRSRWGLCRRCRRWNGWDGEEGKGGCQHTWYLPSVNFVLKTQLEECKNKLSLSIWFSVKFSASKRRGVKNSINQVWLLDRKCERSFPIYFFLGGPQRIIVTRGPQQNYCYKGARNYFNRGPPKNYCYTKIYNCFKGPLKNHCYRGPKIIVTRGPEKLLFQGRPTNYF